MLTSQKPSSTLRSSLGESILYCNYWWPNLSKGKQPRALVFLVHGFGEHCLWYDHIAQPLADEGILVCAHDHVGHGQSEGYPAHVDSFNTYVDDVLKHVDIIAPSYPTIPVFLIGHSMGGTISILASLKRSDYFRGAVLIGSAIVPSTSAVAPWKVSLGKWISYVCPKLPIEKINPEFVSRDKSVVDEYENDPLNYHGGMRTGWGMALLDAMETIQANMAKNTYPFLLIHGDNDKLCDVSGSKLLYQMAASRDKTLSVYPGAYHQVHREPDGVKEKCIGEILKWITQRIDQPLNLI